MFASTGKRARLVAGAVSCAAAATVWISASGAAAPAQPAGSSSDSTAHLFATVSGPDPGAFGTSLEGAAFDSTGHQSAIWIDEDLSGTLEHVAYQVNSPADATPVPTLHTAAYLSLGTNAYTDSLTLDGQGNVYMAVYGGAEVLEFNADGIQIGQVALPPSAPNVTHVAIRPGTRHAYVTASGPGGGYIYTFQALAAAPAGAPNGG